MLDFAGRDTIAAPGRDPRQRGRHDLARVRGVLPRDAGGRRGDRPELSEIGRRYFDMNNPRLHLYHEDARPFMRRIDARYDVISVDAYRQPYIPFYLTTEEFFERCATGSRPDGVAGRERRPPGGRGRPREGAERPPSARRFPHVMRDPIKDTNTLLVASRVAALGAPRLTAPDRRRPCGRAPRPPARTSSRPLRGRRRLHRRQGAGGVADRQVDRGLRGREVSAPADVAIIGGGIVGCAAAAFLAEAGVRVDLYEGEEVAAAASGQQLRLGAAPVRPGAEATCTWRRFATTASSTTSSFRRSRSEC